jgi:hypothetical protein
MVHIGIIEKIFKSSFLINLFGDTHVTRIFYQSSQTCGTKKKNNMGGSTTVRVGSHGRRHTSVVRVRVSACACQPSVRAPES